LTSPRVEVVRVFSDSDYVFAHTEYDFGGPRVGFEVFRFEEDQAVEHWDNIQEKDGPNPSGRSMTDGPTRSTDGLSTEKNRETVSDFAEEVLIGRKLGRTESFVDSSYIEHNPRMRDGSAELLRHLAEVDASSGELIVRYERLHRVLADGSFVLSVCEGTRCGVHTAFYDLFRLSEGLIQEHWDTTEPVPPMSEWKNENGKF
jgi:predicted SnoaL-like aldol condensation-catalyzing enzyme